MPEFSRLEISFPPVPKGSLIGLAANPAISSAFPGLPHGFTQDRNALARLKVGAELLLADGLPAFRAVSLALLPAGAGHAGRVVFLEALRDEPGNRIITCSVRRQGYALAWITLSDKGAAGQRDDASGPLIAEKVAGRLPLCRSQGFILPDEVAQIRALLIDLACTQGYELILTTGGTGVSPRDVTPQATLAAIEQRLPGIEQAMLAASLAKTPHAVISRAVAGTLGASLIVNLPGSRKAVAENLDSVLPALPHLLEKLAGSPIDCGELNA